MKYYYYNLQSKELTESEESVCPFGLIPVVFKGDYEHYREHPEQYDLAGNMFLQEGEVITEDK